MRASLTISLERLGHAILERVAAGVLLGSPVTMYIHMT